MEEGGGRGGEAWLVSLRCVLQILTGFGCPVFSGGGPGHSDNYSLQEKKIKKLRCSNPAMLTCVSLPGWTGPLLHH